MWVNQLLLFLNFTNTAGLIPFQSYVLTLECQLGSVSAKKRNRSENQSEL